MQTKQIPISEDELVMEATNIIRITGKTPTEVADLLFKANFKRLSSYLRNKLAVIGLARTITDAMAQQRKRLNLDDDTIARIRNQVKLKKQNGLERISKVIINGQVRAQARMFGFLSNIVLQGADNIEKSLLEFNIDDIKKWISKSKSNEQAWIARKSWFQKTRNLCKQFGVKTISQLPKDSLLVLNMEAKEIWTDKS